jgi:hypothetical protein
MMLKAKAGNTVFFGLSETNIVRLREGKPIKIDMYELGLFGSVIIFYGETEEKMRDDLAEFVGPDTNYRDTLKKH